MPSIRIILGYTSCYTSFNFEKSTNILKEVIAEFRIAKECLFSQIQFICWYRCYFFQTEKETDHPNIREVFRELIDESRSRLKVVSQDDLSQAGLHPATPLAEACQDYGTVFYVGNQQIPINDLQ